MTHSTFPEGFVWGAATAAYQIEGGREDRKGESIWDRFSHTPGKILGGDTGDVACDHYHRFYEDVAIMKELGLKAYRFSIAWTRLLPEGHGPVNPAGLAFYDRLVDALLEAGIQPFATLYHWDLPQSLQEAGGWPARHTVEAFLEYTDLATRRLGDRVAAWATLNEPYVSAYIGYAQGIHAPGAADLRQGLAAGHHLLLAHGLAVPVIRTNAPAAQVGIVLNLNPVYPASSSAADRAQARRDDAWLNRWYLDPLSGRGYPVDALSPDELPLEFIQPGDMENIATPIDYLGVNNYSRSVSRGDETPDNLPWEIELEPETTSMGWEVYPPGIGDLLTRLSREYAFPALYVTENGAAYPDEISPDGAVHDPQRIAYIQGHLASCARAIQAGAPLKGYFVWSLMDNFEWTYGYSMRFGLVYVDFPTQKRILKDSACRYREVIRRNGVN